MNSIDSIKRAIGHRYSWGSAGVAAALAMGVATVPVEGVVDAGDPVGEPDPTYITIDFVNPGAAEVVDDVVIDVSSSGGDVFGQCAGPDMSTGSTGVTHVYECDLEVGDYTLDLSGFAAERRAVYFCSGGSAQEFVVSGGGASCNASVVPDVSIYLDVDVDDVAIPSGVGASIVDSGATVVDLGATDGPCDNECFGAALLPTTYDQIDYSVPEGVVLGTETCVDADSDPVSFPWSPVSGDSLACVVTFTASGSLSGTVVDDSGDPVDAATVRILDGAGGEVAMTTTDEFGLYEIDPLVGDDLVVEFSASGFVTEFHDDVYTSSLATALRVLGDTTVDAELTEPGILAGIVTSEGSALDGVSVSLRDAGDYWTVLDTATTGLDGSYSFTTAPGLYRVGFEKDDFATVYFRGGARPYDGDLIAVAGGATTGGVNVDMLLSGSLSGTIFDPDDQPADVWVNAYRIETGQTFGISTESSDGSYLFDNLPVGRYLVYVSDSRFAAQFYLGTADQVAATEVVVAPAQNSALDPMTLAAGVGVEGEIVDEATGLAIDGASISINPTGFLNSRSAFSGPTGAFLLSNLADTSYSIFVSAPGYATTYLPDLTVAGIDIDLGIIEMVVSPPPPPPQGSATVSGVVSGTFGPVDSVYVSANGGGDYTDESGQYEITVVPLDGVTMYVNPPSGSGLTNLTYTLGDISDGDVLTGVDVTLAAGGTMTGVVTADNDDAPLSFVAVTATNTETNQSETVPTAGDGSFRIEGLPAGDYRVRFQALRPSIYLDEYYDDVTDRYNSTIVTVGAGATTAGIDAQLAQGVQISGRVTDADNFGIAGANVELRRTDEYSSRFAQTDESGFYHLAAVSSTGTYRLEFGPPSGANYLREYWEDTTEYGDAELLSLTAGSYTYSASLTAGATVDGVVTGPDGEPVPNVSVDLNSIECCDGSSASTDETGAYEVSGLPPGEYNISFNPPSSVNLLREYWSDQILFANADAVTLASGDTFTASAQLAAGAEISGSIAFPAGTLDTDANVTLRRLDEFGGWPYFESNAADDGEFLFGGLAGGSYRVEVAPSDPALLTEAFENAHSIGYAYPSGTVYDIEPTPIVLADLEERAIAIELDRAGTLTGTLSVPGSYTPDDFDVIARQLGTFNTLSAIPSASGDYSFEGLPPADYEVCVNNTRVGSYVPEDNLYGSCFGGVPGTDSGATPVTVAVATDVSDIDLALVPGVTISGIVRDDLGVAVDASSIGVSIVDGYYYESWAGSTGTDGSYTIPGVRPGVDVKVFASGVAPLTDSGFYDLDPSDDDPTSVPTTTDVDDVDIELARFGSISGTVTDLSGAPIPGVYVSGNGGFDDTDENGEYTIPARPRDQRISASGSSVLYEYYSDTFDAYIYGDATVIPVSSGESITGKDFRLSNGGFIRGEAHDPDGNSISSASIFFFSEGDGDFGGNYYEVGSFTDGSFEFGTVRPGTYELFIAPSDVESPTLGNSVVPVSVTVVEGEVAEVVVVAPLGGVIAGVVSDSAGQPIEGIEVFLGRTYHSRTAWTMTGSDGSYSFAGLDQRDYNVGVEDLSDVYVDESYLDATDPIDIAPVAVALGSTSPVDFELDRAGSISGTLTTGPAGDRWIFAYRSISEAYAGPIVASSSYSYNDRRDTPRAIVSNGEQFTITGLAAGDWIVCVDGTPEFECWNDSATVSGASTVPVAAGQNVVGIDIDTTSAPDSAPDPVALGSVYNSFASDPTLTVSWSRPSNVAITQYRVEWRLAGSSDEWSTKLVRSDQYFTTANTTITGLTLFADYEVRVISLNSVGESPASEVRVARPTGTFARPSTPVDFEAAPSAGGASLTWAAPALDGGDPVTGYQLEVWEAVSQNDAVLVDELTYAGATTSAQVANLKNGVEYYLNLRAENRVGSGLRSYAEVTPIAGLPDAPGAPEAVAGDGSVELSWALPASNGGSPITDYVIERRVGAAAFAVVADGVSTARSFNDSGRTNGETYDYRISAVTANGTSAPSTVVSATPTAAPQLPSAPTSLLASPGDGSVVLSWAVPASNGGSSITDYVIERRTGAAPFAVITDGVSTALSFTDNGRTNGTTYDYRVSAVTATGTGAPSSVASATPVASLQAPGAPTALAASPGDGEATLTWSAPTSDGGAAIADYVIEVKPGSGAFAVFADGVSTSTVATMTGLTNGVTYTVRVSAKNSVGTGAPSVATTVRPVAPPTAPSAPGAPVATTGDEEVSLTWSAPLATGGAAITDYLVEFRPAGGAWRGFDDGTSTARSATVTGLTNGTVHEFRVSAVNAAGPGAASPTSSATPIGLPGAPTSVLATPGNGSVKVEWNPPVSDGGSAITGYLVEMRPANGTFAEAVNTADETVTIDNLSNGLVYEFRVTAENAVGVGPVSNVAEATPVAPAPTSVAVVPGRVLDTRENEDTIDDESEGQGLSPGGSIVELRVTGRGNVPDDAVAVFLNLAAASQEAGYLTVWPCGEPQPTTSSLNYSAKRAIANAVIAKVGVDGKVCIFNSGTTQIIADVTGFFPAGSPYAALTPGRLMDTRPLETADGQAVGLGTAKAGEVIELQVGGRLDVPIDAAAVVLNVAAARPAFNGYLTVFPCGDQQPTTSSLNYTAGGAVANAVIAKLGVDGKICIFSSQATEIIIDLSGFFPAASGYEPLTPARLLDTRDQPTVDDTFRNLGKQAAGEEVELEVLGRGGVPADAASVVLNVVSISPATGGYFTVYPCGETRPLASSLNFIAGENIGNAAIAKVGTNGKVCIFTSAPAHIVADVSGYFPAA